MIAASEFNDRIEQFRNTVMGAYLHLEAIEAAIAQVGEMYPAIPTESWQGRGGTESYLYMIFPSNGNGSHTGPDGTRKIYIGNKPERIEAARRLAANRRIYNKLQRAHRDLRYWITRQHRAIQGQKPYPVAPLR